MNKASMKAEWMATYLRQYLHNDGSGVVFSYEKIAVENLLNKYIAAESKLAEIEAQEPFGEIEIAGNNSNPKFYLLDKSCDFTTYDCFKVYALPVQPSQAFQPVGLQCFYNGAWLTVSGWTYPENTPTRVIYALAEQPSPAVAVPDCVPYVIRKNGMYYGLGSAGYVSTPLTAEIYTKEEAEEEQSATHGDCQAIPITECGYSAEALQGYIDRLTKMRNAMLSTPTPPSAEQPYASDILFNGVSAGRVPEGIELTFFVDGDEDEHHTKISINEYGIDCLLRSLKFFGYQLAAPVEQPNSAAVEPEIFNNDAHTDIPTGCVLIDGFRWRQRGNSLWNYVFGRAPDSFELRDTEIENVIISKLPSTKPQRITEQDAREIIESFYHFQTGYGLRKSDNHWMNDEGRTLLAKLNEHREPDYKAQRDELVSALKLALEYWQHRQQRYKNRSPVWVEAARSAIAKASASTDSGVK